MTEQPQPSPNPSSSTYPIFFAEADEDPCAASNENLRLDLVVDCDRRALTPIAATSAAPSSSSSPSTWGGGDAEAPSGAAFTSPPSPAAVSPRSTSSTRSAAVRETLDRLLADVDEAPSADVFDLERRFELAPTPLVLEPTIERPEEASQLQVANETPTTSATTIEASSAAVETVDSPSDALLNESSNAAAKSKAARGDKKASERKKADAAQISATTKPPDQQPSPPSSPPAVTRPPPPVSRLSQQPPPPRPPKPRRSRPPNLPPIIAVSGDVPSAVDSPFTPTSSGAGDGARIVENLRLGLVQVSLKRPARRSQPIEYAAKIFAL